MGVLVGAHMIPRAQDLCGTCDSGKAFQKCMIYVIPVASIIVPGACVYIIGMPKAGTCCRFVSRTESLSI